MEVVGCHNLIETRAFKNSKGMIGMRNFPHKKEETPAKAKRKKSVNKAEESDSFLTLEGYTP